MPSKESFSVRPTAREGASEHLITKERASKCPSGKESVSVGFTTEVGATVVDMTSSQHKALHLYPVRCRSIINHCLTQCC